MGEGGRKVGRSRACLQGMYAEPAVAAGGSVLVPVPLLNRYQCLPESELCLATELRVRRVDKSLLPAPSFDLRRERLRRAVSLIPFVTICNRRIADYRPRACRDYLMARAVLLSRMVTNARLLNSSCWPQACTKPQMEVPSPPRASLCVSLLRLALFCS